MSIWFDYVRSGSENLWLRSAVTKKKKNLLVSSALSFNFHTDERMKKKRLADFIDEIVSVSANNHFYFPRRIFFSILKLLKFDTLIGGP